MAGFRSLKKATGQQAALKLGMYGPPGAGKTFTALLIAEGLASLTRKRIAFCDTEHGSDFYCKEVKTRRVHPAAFDFDAVYTRSIMEVLDVVKNLNPDEYGVIVIDSITHIWSACIEAYSGRQTSIGGIPFHAWGKIKKPYMELLSILLSSPMHVIICGRQAVEYATNEETEELQAVGVKMKAEGSTAYEPHILLRMEAVKPKKTNEISQIVAYAEKDRTGVLAGRSFVNPTYEDLVVPMLGLLTGQQAEIKTADETAAQDAEAIGEADRLREAEGEKEYNVFVARITMAMDAGQLKEVGRDLTPKVKAKMGPDRVDTLREKYHARENELAGRLV